ncbi:hypothetical protein Ndes2437B_g04177 [Nannochloris sp. 'desiccata']
MLSTALIDLKIWPPKIPTAPPRLAPLVREAINVRVDINVLSDDIQSDVDEEVFDEADLLGFDIEVALFAAQINKKNKAKSAYRSPNNPRYQKFAQNRKAVGLAKKAKQKQRSLQLNKDIASKEAKLEVVEERRIISSTEVVVLVKRYLCSAGLSAAFVLPSLRGRLPCGFGQTFDNGGCLESGRPT